MSFARTNAKWLVALVFAAVFVVVSFFCATPAKATYNCLVGNTCPYYGPATGEHSGSCAVWPPNCYCEWNGNYQDSAYCIPTQAPSP